LLACAEAGGAEYLVTGDDDLLAIAHYCLTILSAREFLTLLSP